MRLTNTYGTQVARQSNTYGVDDKFVEYPLKVLNGDIVAGELVRLQCKRYLSFFSRDDIYFDEEKADRPVRFISKLKHWESAQFYGKPFILQDWQKFIIHSIYGWIRKDNNTRLARQAYVEISRKNGKTSLAAALALYALLADGEPGAEVDLVAPSSSQSHIALNAAQNYGKSINKHGILKYRNSDILCKVTNSKLRVMSSDSKYNDGFNSSTAIIDEFHAFRDSAIYNLILSSTGARMQPLIFMITTSGFDLYSYCKQFRDMCIEILKGLKTDDTIFPFIYEMDTEDKIEDEHNWKKCCPSLDITVSKTYMREQLVKMKNLPSEEVPIKTKVFNTWCSTRSVWLSEEKIQAASEQFNIIDIFNNCQSAQVYMGIDLASVYDLTSITLLLKTQDDQYYFDTYLFLPEETIATSVHKDKYRAWVQSGHIISTPGNCCDYDYVLGKIIELNNSIPIQQIAYDQWNASQFVINCIEQGLPMKPYAQNLGSFNRPTREFERLLALGKVHINDNPVVRWCFSNSTLKHDKINDNVKPIKSAAGEGVDLSKIDAVITILESLGIMLLETQPPSYFEAV